MHTDGQSFLDKFCLLLKNFSLPGKPFHLFRTRKICSDVCTAAKANFDKFPRNTSTYEDKYLTTFCATKLSRETVKGKLVHPTHENVNFSRKQLTRKTL
jgi:hypothetical protein